LKDFQTFNFHIIARELQRLIHRGFNLNRDLFAKNRQFKNIKNIHLVKWPGNALKQQKWLPMKHGK
jgi:hypothetical protein